MSSTVTSSVARITATLTRTPGAFTTTFAAPTGAKTAAAASIFDPSRPDPTHFDPSNPLVLFIIQAACIIGLSRFLAGIFYKLRQPRVIWEVIAGIILGPSAMGRVPGFTSHIFPPQSVSYINLIANIGLVLFLFVVGLEVDFTTFRKNIRASASISIAGMVIPFALGAAVSVGIYNAPQNYVNRDDVNFGTFLLFIGVANAITAFPVLARILTELRLLQDPVGVMALAAGVGNDVVGWILLALAIALVNASSGIIVLYIILTSIGWIALLWFLGRPILVWICRRTGSYGEHGPTQGVVAIVVCLVFTSAWVTDRIGIHAIFGGFLVGLIVPQQIRVPITERIDDLIQILFLPLYFALSGLNTNLGLLANGSIWGWTVCVIIVAFLSKFLTCAAAAKLNGYTWRPSATIGCLMACKGLVELIVLNIGLNAGILSPAVFAMFVTMALVTTFATTPLTLLFYPKRVRLGRVVEARADGSVVNEKSSGDSDSQPKSRFAVVLDRYDHLPALVRLCKLLQTVRPEVMVQGGVNPTPPTKVTLDALRLVELSERTSDLIKGAEEEDTIMKSDTISHTFTAISTSMGLETRTSLRIAGQNDFADLTATHAEESEADLLVLPWALHSAKVAESGAFTALLPNPLETYFTRGASSRQGSPVYANYVRQVFANAPRDVAVFIDTGTISTPTAAKSHLFLAFHGGADDRAALSLIVQLVTRNTNLSATIVQISRAEEDAPSKEITRDTSTTDDHVLISQMTVRGGQNAADTIYPTGNRAQSETEDELALAPFFDGPASAHSAEVQAALPRLKFVKASASQPLHKSIVLAKEAAAESKLPLVLVAGRGRRDAVSHTAESVLLLKEHIEKLQSSIVASSDVRRSLGDVGVAYLLAGEASSILIVQRTLPSKSKSA